MKINADLWRNQQKAVEVAMSQRATLVPFTMGRGKSLVALKVAEQMNARRVLIVCPKSVIPVWEQYLYQYIEDKEYLIGPSPRVFEIMQSSVKVKVATVGNKAKHIDYLAEITDRPTFLVINYDIIYRPEIFDALIRYDPELIVADEAHRIKSHNSKASKAMHKLGKQARKLLALTGTPYHNAPTDVFGIVRFLDDTIFGRVWYKFRERYEVLVSLGRPGIYKTVGYKNLDELKQKVASISVADDMTDAIQLPDLQVVDFPVEAPPGVMNRYHKFKKDLLLEFEQGTLTADNVLVKSLRLQQLAGGTMDSMGYEDTFKVEALLDLVDGIGSEPFVVFHKFSREGILVGIELDRAGYTFGELSGTFNDLTFWQQGNCQGLIVQIQAGAEGIDLTRARYAFYYSPTYSLGQYEQSLGRLRRPGARVDLPVVVYHLSTRGTIDEQVYSALQSKKQIKNVLMESLHV